MQYSVMLLPLLPPGTFAVSKQLFTAMLEVNLITLQTPCRCYLIVAVLLQRGTLSFW